ncbi:hypothetical protein DPV78_000205 [Talaromyces pinophilus]|nr:hypothetical protein DPV78_000205 [Talaromyces pinophilus]
MLSDSDGDHWERKKEEEDVVQPGHKRRRIGDSSPAWRTRQPLDVHSEVIVEIPSITLGENGQEETAWELLSYEGIPAEERDAVAKYARKFLVKLKQTDCKGATPSVTITTLPSKDPRDPIWAQNP